jgi:hypothetical protein
MCPRVSLGLTLALVLAGCRGQAHRTGAPGAAGTAGRSGAAGLPGGGGASMAAGTTGASGAGGGVAAAPQGSTPLRRLTPREYNNTVRDLLQLGATAAPVLDETSTSDAGFDNLGTGFSVSEQLLAQLLDAAEKLAARADPLKLSACDAKTTGEPACAQKLIADFGRRALRRPLEAAEVGEYTALYDAARTAGDDYATGLRAIITRMLMSPELLHHVERGVAAAAPTESPRLTQYELAARLSYLAWETMPDDTLLAAAAGGTLAGPEVAAQMKRLLADARAKEMVWHFHRQWLRLDDLLGVTKNKERYPSFEATRSDLRESMRRFLDDVVWAGGDVKKLLTSPTYFASPKMAPFYGLTVPGTDFVRIDADPAQRAGLLTQPALLAMLGKADASAPILRGVFVRERLLCSPLPPPPPGASTIPPGTPMAKTTRELYANLTAGSPCNACHDQINPIGFGFEHYDAIGKWRDVDGTTPVDATGNLSVSDVAGPFDGAVALAGKLAGSRDIEACLSRQWFRFGFGRFVMPGDGPLIDQVAARRRADGGRLTALPEAVAGLEAFGRLHYRTQGGTP